MPAPPIAVGRLLAAWVAMLALLAVIAASDYLRLGIYLPWVQFPCAAAIVALLAWQWMNLSVSSVAVRIAACAAIFFLLVLMLLSFSDYLTRRTDLAPFQSPSVLGTPM